MRQDKLTPGQKHMLFTFQNCREPCSYTTCLWMVFKIYISNPDFPPKLMPYFR